MRHLILCALAVLALAACVTPTPGYLDPRAAAGVLPVLVEDHRAYLAADPSLGAAEREARLAQAERVLGWWESGLARVQAAEQAGASPRSGYLDPRAVGDDLPPLVADHRVYLAADQALSEGSRGDRLFVADQLLNWWTAGLEEVERAEEGL